MAITRFRNKDTGYEESIDRAALWCLLFGSFYFAVKGVWSHAVVSFVLAVATGTLSWFVYPFFAQRILERHFEREGWIPVGGVMSSATFRSCPYCAEPVRTAAVFCKHCRHELPAAEEVRVSGQNRESAASFGAAPATSSGQTAQQRKGRSLILAIAFATVAAAELIYWLINYGSQPIDQLGGAASSTALGAFVLVVVGGCIMRKRRPGLAEIGALLGCLVLIAAINLGLMMYDANLKGLESGASVPKTQTKPAKKAVTPPAGNSPTVPR